ncbi:pyridoxamine 5'-phosphate oxidase family protein [Haematobacter genomosp. 1]|uniref:General stress protein n=1 Tax=Haematobacter genomosp. 1 TaxID=366618 RepID=A0A212A8L7_9RHOB|nr:pyridoxamine 5'-phosphate oxidase family protein [Haematobacter genomosp. 1]OWJ76140.1 general stress protein [Haematobacter genomosp. 1]
MPTPQELAADFWKALKSDMTVMLGISGKDDSHTRPMTALFEGEEGGPVWFFTSRDSELVRGLGDKTSLAIATFTSEGHGIFACLHGSLTVDNDRAVVDRLWNRHIAAWYEEGKDDPKLALLRFDPESAEIWKDASGMWAGIKHLFGSDPKEDYKDNVAEVRL